MLTQELVVTAFVSNHKVTLIDALPLSPNPLYTISRILWKDNNV